MNLSNITDVSFLLRARIKAEISDIELKKKHQQVPDPRRVAATLVNRQLLPNDQVAVIGASGSEKLRVLYPLGKPSGADQVIETAGFVANNSLNAALRLAVDELTKPGSGESFNRSAIYAFIDQLPFNDANETLGLLKEMKDKGIYVHIGYVAQNFTGTVLEELEFRNSVLNTGVRLLTRLNVEEDINAFVEPSLVYGITPQDPHLNFSVMLPGISYVGDYNQTGERSTSHFIVEKGKNITVSASTVTFTEAEDQTGLELRLTDTAGKELKKGVLDKETNALKLEYTAEKKTEVVIDVHLQRPDNQHYMLSFGVESSLTCEDKLDPPPAAPANGEKKNAASVLNGSRATVLSLLGFAVTFFFSAL